MGNSSPSSSSHTRPSQSTDDGAANRTPDEPEPYKPTTAGPPETDTRPRRADGLAALGFEYRLVPCREHATGRRSCGAPADEVDGGGGSRDIAPCFACGTRLFHAPSGTMIDSANRREYIPDGRTFDEVSRACQEVAQERIMRSCSLKFVTLFFKDETDGEPVRALVDAECPDGANRALPARPTFLFITGKGKSRAGIGSVKEVIVSGIEKGSALFHLAAAQRRGLAVVCLDPNALGESRGMEVVKTSLDALFGSREEDGDGGRGRGGPVYVLAHSAAGGYLVRYFLLDASRGQSRLLLPRLRAVAFTDSTHRLPWARDDPRLHAFLQSSRCLYVRNDAARMAGAFGAGKEKAEPGEDADVDVWWRQRFGELRTVWAGTAEHSAMCWVARKVLWDFFDNNRCDQKGALLHRTITEQDGD